MYLTVFRKQTRAFGSFKSNVPDWEKTTLELTEDQIDENKLPEACRPLYVQVPIPQNVPKEYREFDIPKRDGSLRHIKEPMPQLKVAQAQLVRYMQMNLKVLPHNAAHGFVKGRGCYSAMKVHQDAGSRWFLKVDIHNFFPSISNTMLLDAFCKIANMHYISVRTMLQMIDIFVDETNHLTQGCKSSPYLANLVMLEFDYKFSEYCAKHGFTYTRYADDMCISAPNKFDKKLTVQTIKRLLPEGLTLSEHKTKLSSINGRNIFLGIHYNQDMDLTVGYKTKKLFKTIMYKAGRGELSREDARLWTGRLYYYQSIEPAYFKAYKETPMSLALKAGFAND